MESSGIGGPRVDLSAGIRPAVRVPTVASLNRELDRIADDVSGLLGTSGPSVGVPFSVDAVTAGVRRWSFDGVRLDPGERLDVSVEVTQSAQRGGLFLDIGGQQFDLASSGSSLTLSFAGPLGTQALSFASGTDLQSLAQAINFFSNETGVAATVSGTGMSIRSVGYGSDEFVSVRFSGNRLDDTFSVSLSDFRPDDASRVGELIAEGDGLFGGSFRDDGQDVAGLVNGVKAFGDGTSLRFETVRFAGALDLGVDASSPANAVSRGSFLALQLVSRAGQAGGRPALDVDG